MKLKKENIPEYIAYLREDTSRMSGEEVRGVIEAFEQTGCDAEQWGEVMGILSRRLGEGRLIGNGG